MKGANNKAKDLSKEDPFAPTQAKPIIAPDTTKNLSHNETKSKLEIYSKVAERSGHSQDFEKLRMKYKSDVERGEKNRIKQDVHFTQGWRVGLHANNNKIKQSREQQDQLQRDEVIRQGKEHYDKNSSMRKDFPKDKPKMKHEFIRSNRKDKGMDKDR